MEMEGIPLEEQVDGSAISVFRPPVFEGGSQGESTASESTSMPQYCRSISGVVEELPNSSKQKITIAFTNLFICCFFG